MHLLQTNECGSIAALVTQRFFYKKEYVAQSPDALYCHKARVLRL